MDLLVSIVSNKLSPLYCSRETALTLDASEHLVIALRELDSVVEWKTLGLNLGLYAYTLQEIEANERSVVGDCKAAMLDKWMSMTDNVKGRGGATKAALVRALREMGQKALASRIEKKGFSSFDSPAPSSEFYIIYTCHSISNVYR